MFYHKAQKGKKSVNLEKNKLFTNKQQQNNKIERDFDVLCVLHNLNTCNSFTHTYYHLMWL